MKLVDLAGALVWMNRNGLGVLEIPDFSAVRGQNWAQFWPESVQLLIAEAFEQAAQGGTRRFEANCPTLRGTPRWWEVSITGVRGRDGALAGYLCISRDVTSRWRDREAL
ncbi:MAG: PAS domain-containing protein, partial [Rubritepida sp.]|nr:PAS domain-containing protein [Rubritepida sp.]